MGATLVITHGSAFLLALALLWWRENGNARLPWRHAAPAAA